MKNLHRLAPLTWCLFLAGCDNPSAQNPKAGSATHAANVSEEEVAIRQALDKLSPEDRQLAQAQKFCAIEEENRLGSMGTPIKVLVKDQPVFLCCKGCRKTALKNPDKTLATVKKLKEENTDKPAKPAK